MSGFTMNFDGRTYDFTPFEVEWNVFQSMEIDFPSVTPPNYFNKFNNVLSSNGTVRSLFDIFKPTWERLRKAGQNVISNYAPAIEVDIDGVKSYLEYNYSYDTTKVNELDINLRYPTGQTVQSFTFNYARGQTTYDREVSSIYCIVNHIVDSPDATYEGCQWFALGAVNAYYVYQGVTTTGGLTPELVSELVGKKITDLLPADVRLRGANPYSIWDYSFTNGFGYKDDIYPQPFGAGFFNALQFNNAVAEEITVNDVNLNDIINNDTPDTDYTNSNNWNVSNWHEPSDPVEFPDEIVNDSLSYGFIHAYYLTPAQALQLSDYLLSDDFITNVKKLFANPIEYIMGMSLLPVVPQNTTPSNIIIGGLDSEIPSNLLTKEFQYFDCGSINVKEKWGGFPDYSPATKCSLYAPFIGMVELNTDDVMDGELTLRYRIDLLTGECVAMLKCDTSRDINGIVYHYRGSVSHSTPITNSDYSQKISAILNGAGAIVGAVASGATGNIGGAISSGVSGATSLIEGFASKPTIQRTGGISGTCGIMDVLTPYLLIDRPVQALPSTYKKLNGYSSCQGGKLNQFTGFVQISEIDLSGLTCTEEEKQEIINDLKGGIFI